MNMKTEQIHAIIASDYPIEELTRAADEMVQAIHRLKEAWWTAQDHADHPDHDYETGFPFPSSLDEFAVDVSAWREEHFPA